MRTLGIDIETYSSVDLIKAGVYAYTSAPDFEILLFAYAFDAEPVQLVDLASGEKLTVELLAALRDDSTLKTAFNANFEKTCLSVYLKQSLSPKAWRCTAVQSAMLGLPLYLAGVAKVLGLEEQKMSEGKALIRYFSIPCKPTKTNGGRTRNLPNHAPEKWATFRDYCKRDVEVERAIRGKIEKYPISVEEQKLWMLDQQINDQGILVDTQLVHNAIQCDKRYRMGLFKEAKELTGLDNPNSVAQLKEWLLGNGLKVENLSKKVVADLASVTEGALQRLLQLRQEMAKTSIKKYNAMQRAICPDNHVRGLLQFYGANRTGRWAGRLVQVQNLPQNHLPDLKSARDIVKNGDYDFLEMVYDSVPGVLSELIRTAFIPSKGHRLIVADFSAIEARVIAWLAGETWRMEVFATHGKIYEASASQMFKVPKERIVKGNPEYELRQKGKVAELACIAEGQLVLTDHGLVPIEKVTIFHKVWDGETFVKHDGILYKGEREVISYAGLIATKDHLVWIEGQSEPVRFDYAAACRAHLLQSGHGRQAIRVGKKCRYKKTYSGNEQRTDYHGSRRNETQELANHPSKVRVYDLLNVGNHNRFTVSNCLVHNCGYQGGANALAAMGALDMGLKEEELDGLVKAWRKANSNIVKYWYAVEDAAKKAVSKRQPSVVGAVKFQVESGILFITLPSGRKLSYIKPKIEINQFGREAISYEGIGENKQWCRMGTYGGRLVENIVQATARDCLAEAMLRVDKAGYKIVMHVHDEIIIDAPIGFGSLEDVCKIMGQPIRWAKGLPLRAAGFETDFYKKD